MGADVYWVWSIEVHGGSTCILGMEYGGTCRFGSLVM